jgi:hypothetical protein
VDRAEGKNIQARTNTDERDLHAFGRSPCRGRDSPLPFGSTIWQPVDQGRTWERPIMEYWVQIAVGTAAFFALLASAIEGARLWRSWRRTHR